MTWIWTRRRSSLPRRIVRSLLLMGASIGVAVAAELLRRRFGIGSARAEVVRDGRRARLRVSIHAPRRAARRKRASSAARS